jgi:hypothetical protein
MIVLACPRCASGRLLTCGEDYSCLNCGDIVYRLPVMDTAQAEREVGPLAGRRNARRPKHGNIRL